MKTVLEKTGKFSGRLRKQKTKHLLGEKTKEALYRENDCVFRLNVDDVYFSSRLSNERKEIAKRIKKGEKVLVLFAGAAPYPVVIAKNSKAKIVYSNEINREANKYAKLNIELNNVKDKVVLIPGDIKKVAEKHPDKKYVGWIHDHSYINEFKIKPNKIAINNINNPLFKIPSAFFCLTQRKYKENKIMVKK